MVSSLKRKMIIVDGASSVFLWRWRYLTPLPMTKAFLGSEESIAEALRAVLQHIEKRIVGERTV
jgi:hypothetical protein